MYLSSRNATVQFERMWWREQTEAPQSGQLLVLFKPQSFKRFGVRTQLTEASKTNLTIRGLIPPQIKFFQLMSKGKAFSAHCSQAPCCFKEVEWAILCCSAKVAAFADTSSLYSARDVLGLNFPNPIPCLFGWLGNFKSRFTSAFASFTVLVAFQTYLRFAFWSSQVL